MFTGIIQQQGVLVKTGGAAIAIETPLLPVKLGDSVAVNGICLTVVGKRTKGKKSLLTFDISQETRQKTTLKHWKLGTRLNVEPAMRTGDAFGGHMVQGHVDGVASVVKVTVLKDSTRLWFETSKEIAAYLVSKGSVAIDGVSLTVVDPKGTRFSVALVPFTLHHTNLKGRRVGDSVNVEADVIGKYIYRYLKKK